jgi:hypothetical protein
MQQLAIMRSVDATAWLVACSRLRACWSHGSNLLLFREGHHS